MAYAPPFPSLQTTVRVTPAAATALSSTVLDIPLAVWLHDSAIGFQWHVAIKIGGEWNQISVQSGTPGITLGKIYGDGQVPEIIAEINAMGMAAWVLREIRSWLNALLRAFFASKVSDVVAPIDLTRETFQDAINAHLGGLTLTVGADGVPQL